MIPTEKKTEALCLCVLAFCLGLGVVWLRTQTVKATYHFVRLEKELIQLEHEIQSGRITWLKATAPERLEKVARQYDLKRPKKPQIYKLDFLAGKP